MGIYDTIIGCINSLFKDFKKCVKTLWPYALGMLAGILGLAKLITYLLAIFPLPTNMTFIGLILGGLPMIVRKMKGEKTGVAGVVAFVLAFALVVGLKAIGGGNGTDAAIVLSFGQLIVLFLMGVIAAATMVIPGVSGSMMLMLLGYYNPVVGSVSGLVDALIARDMGAILNCCGVLIPFGIGVVIGIFAVAKLIEVLLNRFPGPTYCAILGLVTASPVAILMGLSLSGITVMTVVISIVALIAGAICAYKLGGE